jgi:ketosteroid isomerase-like protein
VVREFDDLGNGVGDLDRLDALCTPDLVNHALAGSMPAGLEGTRQFLQRARRDLHPARWLETHIVAEGDLVVQFGAREAYWPGGPFRGVDLTAGPVTGEVAFAYRFRDGRICERWAIRDDLAMIHQLGRSGSSFQWAPGADRGGVGCITPPQIRRPDRSCPDGDAGRLGWLIAVAQRSSA